MKILYMVQIATLASRMASAQGTFQNLDFDATLIPEDQAPGFVSVTDALPGWTAYISTNSQSQMGFNNPSLGATSISLQGTNTLGFPTLDCALPGFYCGYSALLQGGLSPFDFSHTDASIAQTGLIPSGSKSIRFEASAFGSAPLVVSVGGHALPLSVISLSGNVFVLGADISAYAGQTAELRFDALSPPVGVPSPNNWEIDSIQFSTSAIPEPTPLCLLALGALLMVWRWSGKNQ